MKGEGQIKKDKGKFFVPNQGRFGEEKKPESDFNVSLKKGKMTPRPLWEDVGGDTEICREGRHKSDEPPEDPGVFEESRGREQLC